MRISRKSEYALRALIAMARARRSWQIAELSAQEKIPVKFLEQILLVLRRGGLLTSKRGVGGGYSLATPPARITVGQIVTLMDGAIAPVPCAIDPTGRACSCRSRGSQRCGTAPRRAAAWAQCPRSPARSRRS